MRVQTAAADSVQAAEEEQPAPPQQKPVYEVKTTSMSAAPLRYLPVPVYILVRKDFT